MEDEPVATPTIDTKEMSVAPPAMYKAGDKTADEDESIDYFKKLAADG